MEARLHSKAAPESVVCGYQQSQCAYLLQLYDLAALLGAFLDPADMLVFTAVRVTAVQ